MVDTFIICTLNKIYIITNTASFLKGTEKSVNLSQRNRSANFSVPLWKEAVYKNIYERRLYEKHQKLLPCNVPELDPKSRIINRQQSEFSFSEDTQIIFFFSAQTTNVRDPPT